MFVSDKFYNQGLVLNGRPNLKLFNQLYWLIMVAGLLVGHVVFPLPQLISGTFPAQSRYRPNNTIFITSPRRRGRICLLRAIHPDFESENKGLRQRLILLISILLLMLFIWHFYAKVSPLKLERTFLIYIFSINPVHIKGRRFMQSFCPYGRMSSIGRYRRNVLTLKQVKIKENENW